MLAIVSNGAVDISMAPLELELHSGRTAITGGGRHNEKERQPAGELKLKSPIVYLTIQWDIWLVARMIWAGLPAGAPPTFGVHTSRL